MAVKKKKGGGFWRGLFLYLLGVSSGMAGAAGIAVYVNELPLPFITPPTRQADGGGEEARKRDEREIVEFRDLLRQSQPQQELSEEKTSPPTTATARSFVYYLQVGAFRDVERAEGLRGQLVLQGRQVDIRDSTLADGNILYRVWMGPYKEENDAENIRAQLALDGYANVSLLKTAE